MVGDRVVFEIAVPRSEVLEVTEGRRCAHEGCRKPLGSTRRADAKYCNDSCRQAAWAARKDLKRGEEG